MTFACNTCSRGYRRRTGLDDVPSWPAWRVTTSAPATLRGYRYDLRHFLAWHRTVQDSAFAVEGLAEYELIAYRQHMVAAGRRTGDSQSPAGCVAPTVPMGARYRRSRGRRRAGCPAHAHGGATNSLWV